MDGVSKCSCGKVSPQGVMRESLSALQCCPFWRVLPFSVTHTEPILGQQCLVKRADFRSWAETPSSQGKQVQSGLRSTETPTPASFSSLPATCGWLPPDLVECEKNCSLFSQPLLVGFLFYLQLNSRRTHSITYWLPGFDRVTAPPEFSFPLCKIETSSLVMVRIK